jgi:LacI family transcriptional regulator
MAKYNMRDVARLAGVSIATVSHAINNTRHVSDASRNKVMTAVEQLGYAPDIFARGMRTGKKNIIGFVVPDISNKYFATIIERVEDVLSENGYFLTIFNTKEEPQREIEHMKYLTSGAVDGLLIASTLEDLNDLRKLAPENLPVVLVDRNTHSIPFDSVVVANYQALYQGVLRLVKDGRGRIGYIAGLPRLSTTKERLGAYIQGMRDCDMQIEDNFIQYGNSMKGSARSCMEELVRKRCDAVIVSNGQMSLDVLEFTFNNNLEIGKDIDLLCFNDFENIMVKFFPLYIVSQPVKDLGYLAGKQILSRINNIDAPVKEILLSGTFFSKYDSKEF